MKKILLTLLIVLLTSTKCYALTPLTRTVCPSGCDHTTLNAAFTWIETNHANMVTSDVSVDIVISGVWSSDDTTVAALSGVTTDATRRVNIYTTGSARHAGKVGADNYKLKVTGFVEIALTIGIANVTVDGLILGSMNGTPSVAAQLPRYPIDSSTTVFKNNIIIDGSYGVDLGGDGVVGATVRNNIIYDCTVGIYAYGTGGTDNKFYNNTLYNNTTNGILITSGSSGTIVKNNLAIGNTIDYSYSGTTVATNGSGDSTGTGSLISLDGAVEFVDTSTRDLLLKTGAESIGEGSDLSGTFTDDVNGGTRTVPFDLSADEFGTPATSARRIISIQ